MNPAGAPGSPWRLRRFEALASTSDLLVQLAAAGEPAGLAVLAARQTAGRGTRGRAWASTPGSLALSVLLRPPGPASRAGQWALLAAVALADALAHHAPGAALSLKWPNDVLLDGRKLGGILIDGAAASVEPALGSTSVEPKAGSTGGGGLLWLVIGFGANLGAAPELPDRVAAGLGVAAAPAEVAATLLDRLDHWQRVVLLDGFAPVRAAWLARAHPPGTHLRLRAGAAEVGGEFAGLGDDGALLLRTGGRVRSFSAGEVLQGGEGGQARGIAP